MNLDRQSVLHELDARLQQYGVVEYRAGLKRYVQVAAVCLAVLLIPIAIMRQTDRLADFSAELLIFGAVVISGIVTSIVAAKPLLRSDAAGITIGKDERYTWDQIERIGSSGNALEVSLTNGERKSIELPGEVDSFAAWLRSLADRAHGQAI